MKFKEIYQKVCSLVSEGLTIEEAIKSIGEISKKNFYKHLTEQQRLNLEHVRYANKMRGNKRWFLKKY